jgi:hypothetical protein
VDQEAATQEGEVKNAGRKFSARLTSRQIEGPPGIGEGRPREGALTSSSFQMRHNRPVAADWVPVATAAIGAAAGLSGAWLTARLAIGRDREARYQERKAEVYVDLLASMGYTNARVSRLVADDPTRTQLPALETSQAVRVGALLRAYGSKKIRHELYPRFSDALSEFKGLAELPELPEHERKIKALRLRTKIMDAHDAVADQIRRELETEPQTKSRPFLKRQPLR